MSDLLKPRLGTRGSPLALWQTEQVAQRLIQQLPGCQPEICIIKTQGDSILDLPLAQIGDKGLFTQELEQALLKQEIDLAIHSLKDLPTGLPEGLALGAILERHDPHDVLVSQGDVLLQDLPAGAVVGTGSQRRRTQLMQARPDLIFQDLRGNIQTRLNKLDRGDYAAILMARAALDRLQLSHRISQVLPLALMLPAVGQGAIGVEISESRQDLKTLLAALHDPNTGLCCGAERSFLHALGGGCQTPLGAYATLLAEDPSQMLLYGYLSTEDGQHFWREKIEGPAADAEALGIELAQRLKMQLK
jgi:hydroxymethylbilane synthase